VTHSRPPLPPYLGLGLGVLATSTASIFIRYAQADGAPSLVIAAWRLSLAALVLAPIVLWRHRGELARLTGREWSLVATSGFFLGLHFAAWITSLAYTTVANSVVFVSTAPLFVALFAAALLRERLTRPVLAGIGVALAGSLVVGLSDACGVETGCPSLSDFVRGQGFYGDMLALAGAAAVAIYLIIGRSVRARLSLLVYIFLTYGAAALTLLAGVWVTGAPLRGFTPADFPASLGAGLAARLADDRAPLAAGSWAVWVLLLALVPQLIGHSSFNWALRYLPATFVSVTVLGEPIGSTVLAFVLLNEVPTPLKVLGGGLILLGILIAAQRGDDRQPKS